MPKRIQRRRARGWRMPENAVYVGRPTKWGNPMKLPDGASDEDRLYAVDSYRFWIIVGTGRKLDLSELTGKDLACFCPLDKPCHADVLLELANAGVDSDA